MIAYLKGTLAHKTMSSVIVENAGMGLEVNVSASTLAKLPSVGAEVQIFTYMNVKEDDISLFGFATMEEKEMFLKLLTVNGVGPKGAMGVLAHLSPQEIVMAILTDDVKTLSKAQGIGKKTAQRMILDLKDKCKTEDAMPQGELPISSGTNLLDGAKFEAIEAMEALGYSRSEAAKAVNAVTDDGMDASAITKAALKKMITF